MNKIRQLIDDVKYTLLVALRIQCDKAGYPYSEARYASFKDWMQDKEIVMPQPDYQCVTPVIIDAMPHVEIVMMPEGTYETQITYPDGEVESFTYYFRS